jgi:hypothetical protein
MQISFSSLVRKFAGWTPGREQRALARLRPDDRRIVEEIRAARLTYLSNTRLESIISAVRAIVADGLPGDFVEAGCALGGSAILISRLKDASRTLRIFDVFGTIPPPGDNDPVAARRRYETIQRGLSGGIGEDTYYGYEKDLYELVAANFTRFGIDRTTHHVELIRGLLQETLVIDRPVALAHIDVDWYEPVKVSLERIVPHLTAGGSVIIDDYADWGGCRKATDEYFSCRRDEFTFDIGAGSLKVTKLGAARR